MTVVSEGGGSYDADGGFFFESNAFLRQKLLKNWLPPLNFGFRTFQILFVFLKVIHPYNGIKKMTCKF